MEAPQAVGKWVGESVDGMQKGVVWIEWGVIGIYAKEWNSHRGRLLFK